MAQPSRLQRNARKRSGNHAERAAERFAAGDPVQAEKHCRRALAQWPAHPDLWHLLAALRLAAADLPAAETAIERARKLAPGDADYANTEALILERSGAEEAAVAAWCAVVARAPDHADACYNLGRLLVARGQFVAAIALLERALAVRPRWADACKNLGIAQFRNGQHLAAERAFSAALHIDANDRDSRINLARLRHEADDYAGAFALYRAVLAHGIDDATLLRFALLTPIFCDDAAAIAEHRARVMANLAGLAARPLALDDPVRTLGTPTFYTAYQGLDDCALMSALGDVIVRAWRPPALPTASRPLRPRIAFVSAHFKAHTIGRLYAPLLERLPRDGFDVAVLSLGRHDDALARRIADAAEISVAVPEDLTAARHALAALAPAIIVYCDLGMDPVSSYLAAERLAPVQCVTWGHPLTSGLDTLDYFLSSTLIEPAAGARHYRETLISLPCWPVLYDPPTSAIGPARAKFGFAAHEHIYLCPQSLFKLHPDFDDYLAAILRADDAAVVVLIETRAAWRQRLEARFARRLPDLALRIRFVAAVGADVFMSLLASADVVLDTPYFSGGYTTFETIWAETPFVTTRGAFMRGRVSAGLCDLLDLTDPIADGSADYAARAVRFACDRTARDQFVSLLAARKHRLLALDASVLPAYRAFFVDTLASAEQRRHRSASA